MLKSSGSNSFFNFLRQKGSVWLILAVASVGLLILAFGMSGSTNDGGDDLRLELEELCSSLDGVGECRVMLTYESGTDGAKDRVQSVAIACRGADSVAVRRRLTEFISALFGIGANRIGIEKLD